MHLWKRCNHYSAALIRLIWTHSFTSESHEYLFFIFKAGGESHQSCPILVQIIFMSESVSCLGIHTWKSCWRGGFYIMPSISTWHISKVSLVKTFRKYFYTNTPIHYYMYICLVLPTLPVYLWAVICTLILPLSRFMSLLSAQPDIGLLLLWRKIGHILRLCVMGSILHFVDVWQIFKSVCQNLHI